MPTAVEVLRAQTFFDLLNPAEVEMLSKGQSLDFCQSIRGRGVVGDLVQAKRVLDLLRQVLGC